MIMTEHDFLDIASQKILILDGPMGTMIQNEKLDETDFRGSIKRKYDVPIKGNNDFLNLSKPDLICDIHMKYLEAGADIIETNTFNSTKISQKDYTCEDISYQLNFEGAKIARKAIESYRQKYSNSPKFIAGVIGPTNQTCSMSPDVNRPEFRNIQFDELKKDYLLSIQGLLDGGSDLIMVETIFDTLNAKAALMAIYELELNLKKKINTMISATITDLSGRTLSGQTLEAFYNSIIHSDPISVGLNCALGSKDLDPHIKELNKFCQPLISVHANAGLPNAFGEYDETPKNMADYAGKWSSNGFLNIIGGCCGSTPEHIFEIKKATEKFKPRKIHKRNDQFRLSGLEPFNL